MAENDGYGRFRFGVPPKTKGDLAFVQHMVAVLNAAGRLGVVMPHGVLFRGSAEGKIRQELLQEDLFEAVIGIAPNLFIRHRHPGVDPEAEPEQAGGAQGQVLFIDASGEFEEGSNQNRLRDQDIEHIGGTLPCLRRRGEVRPGRVACRDRAERLEPEHQPLRGHFGVRRSPSTSRRRCASSGSWSRAARRPRRR